MNTFIKENKQLVITAGIILFFIILIIIFNAINSATKEAADETKATNNKEAEYTLPELTRISAEKEPMLHDYVNGSDGYLTDITKLAENQDEFIFLLKNDSLTIYSVYHHGYQGAGNIIQYLPNFTSAPCATNFESAGQRDKFIDDMDKYLDSDRVTARTKKAQEGVYTFYVVPSMHVLNKDANSFYSLDAQYISDKGTSEHSIMQESLENGGGYPTEMIRKRCDLKKILDTYKVDFNDKFWDTANYKERLLCSKVDKSNNKGEKDYNIKGDEIYIEAIIIYSYGNDKYSIVDADYFWGVNGHGPDNLTYKLTDMGFQSLDDVLKDSIHVSAQKKNTIDSLNKY